MALACGQEWPLEVHDALLWDSTELPTPAADSFPLSSLAHLALGPQGHSPLCNTGMHPVQPL